MAGSGADACPFIRLHILPGIKQDPDANIGILFPQEAKDIKVERGDKDTGIQVFFAYIIRKSAGNRAVCFRAAILYLRIGQKICLPAKDKSPIQGQNPLRARFHPAPGKSGAKSPKIQTPQFGQRQRSYVRIGLRRENPVKIAGPKNIGIMDYYHPPVRAQAQVELPGVCPGKFGRPARGSGILRTDRTGSAMSDI